VVETTKAGVTAMDPDGSATVPNYVLDDGLSVTLPRNYGVASLPSLDSSAASNDSGFSFSPSSVAEDLTDFLFTFSTAVGEEYDAAFDGTPSTPASTPSPVDDVLGSIFAALTDDADTTTVHGVRNKRAAPICTISSAEIVDVLSDYPGLVVVRGDCDNQVVHVCQGDDPHTPLGSCTMRNGKCAILPSRTTTCDNLSICVKSGVVASVSHPGCFTGSITVDKFVSVVSSFIRSHLAFSVIMVLIGVTYILCRFIQCGAMCYGLSLLSGITAALTELIRSHKGSAMVALVALCLCVLPVGAVDTCYDLNFNMVSITRDCGEGTCFIINSQETCICKVAHHLIDGKCVSGGARGVLAGVVPDPLLSCLASGPESFFARYQQDNPLSFCPPVSTDLFASIIDFTACRDAVPINSSTPCPTVDGFGRSTTCSALPYCHSDLKVYGIGNTDSFLSDHPFSKVHEMDTAVVYDISVSARETPATAIDFPMLLFEIPERFLKVGVCSDELPDMLIRTRPSDDTYLVGNGALDAPTTVCTSHNSVGSSDSLVYRQPHLTRDPYTISYNNVTHAVARFYKIEIYCVNEKFGPKYAGFGMDSDSMVHGVDPFCPLTEFAFAGTGMYMSSVFRFGTQFSYVTTSQSPGFNDLFIYGQHFHAASLDVTVQLNTSISSHDGYLVFHTGRGPCRAVDMLLAMLHTQESKDTNIVTVDRRTVHPTPDSPVDSGVEKCSADVLVHTHTDFMYHYQGVDYLYSYHPTSWYVPTVTCTDGDHPVELAFVYSNGMCFNLEYHFAYKCMGLKDSHVRLPHSNSHITRKVCIHGAVQCTHHESPTGHELVHTAGLQVNGKYVEGIPTPERHSCYSAVIACSDVIVSRHVCGEVCGNDDFWRMLFSYPYPYILRYKIMSESDCYDLYGMLPTAIIAAMVNIVFWLLLAVSLIWFIIVMLWNLRSFVRRYLYSSTRCSRCLIEYHDKTRYIQHLSLCYYDPYKPTMALVGGVMRSPGVTYVPIMATREFPVSSSLYAIPGPVYWSSYFRWLVSRYSKGAPTGHLESWYHLSHHKICNKYYPMGAIRWIALIGMYLWRITIGNMVRPSRGLHTLLAIIMLTQGCSAIETKHDFMPKSSLMTGHPYSTILPPIQFLNSETCHTDTSNGVVCDFSANWELPMDDISYTNHFVFVGPDGHELAVQIELLKNRLELFKEFEYCTSSFKHHYFGRRMCSSSSGGRCSWSSAYNDAPDSLCSPVQKYVPDHIVECPYVEACQTDWWKWDSSGCGCWTWSGLVGKAGSSDAMVRRYTVPDLTSGYSCIWRLTSQVHRFQLCVTMLGKRECSDVEKSFADIEVSGHKLHFEFMSTLPDVPTHVTRIGLRVLGGSPTPASVFDAHAFSPINMAIPGAPGDLQFLHFGSLNHSLCTSGDMKIPTFDLSCNMGSSPCWTYDHGACLAASVDGSTFGCDESNLIVGYDTAVADTEDYFPSPKSTVYYRYYKANLYDPKSAPTAEFFGVPPDGTFLKIVLRTPRLKLALSADKTHLDLRSGVHCTGTLHAWSFISCTITVFNPLTYNVTDRFYVKDGTAVIMPHSYLLHPGVNPITLQVNSHTSIKEFTVCASFHTGNCADFSGDITHEFVRNMTTVHDPYASHIYGQFEGMYQQIMRQAGTSEFWIWLVVAILSVLFVVGGMVFMYRWLCVTYSIAGAIASKFPRRRVRYKKNLED